MNRCCRDCKQGFYVQVGEEWKTLCVKCFKRRKRQQDRDESETWQTHRSEAPVEVFARQVRRAALDLYREAERALESEHRREVEDAYRRGLTEGRQQGGPVRPGPGPRLDAATLRALVALVHPDRHPASRSEQANRLTQLLNNLIDDERKAA